MIEITISEEEKQKARKFQGFMEELKGGLSSTIIATKDYRIIGQLGQEVVKKYFDFIGISYLEPDEGYGRHNKDSCDLIVGNKKIDVKSSKKYDTICLNHNQYWKTFYKKIDYMIGVHFVDDSLKKAIIFGYGYWQDLKRDYEKDFIYNGEKKEMYSLPYDKIKKFKICDIII